jgi:hypothetical protein
VFEHVLEKVQFCVVRAIVVGFAQFHPQLMVGTSLHGGGL